MSIASEITRLQNIKTNIRSALVTQGVPAASGHDMADFSADILSISTGGGATITVTYSSEFYNKTMTCTKGTTTYTETTTSSGSTVFNVDSSGTWTITCNGVSRTVDVVLEYITQMAITQTVTVYGAASDTVSFTDITGAKTVTTDTSGQGSVSISFIPNSTITFTSSVAKNPTDLSQYYSKTVTVNSGTTEVKVMPDGAIYWYGYYKGTKNDNLTFNASYTSRGGVTFNTNNVVLEGITAYTMSFLATSLSEPINLTGYTNLKTIGNLQSGSKEVKSTSVSSTSQLYLEFASFVASNSENQTRYITLAASPTVLSSEVRINFAEWAAYNNYTVDAVWLE